MSPALPHSALSGLIQPEGRSMSNNADRIASLDIERLRRTVAGATAEIGAKARQANALDTERRRLLAE
jgi:hypothetical protein